MDNRNALNIDPEKDVQSALAAERKKILIWIVVLITVNTTIFTSMLSGTSSTQENLFVALNVNLIGFNLVGFIIGRVVAFIPYKGLPYKRKYLRASLLTILTIQFIMLIALVIIVLKTWFSPY